MESLLLAVAGGLVGLALARWTLAGIAALVPNQADAMLHFEKDRMSLQCASCGHQTPGWDLDEISRPSVAVRAEAPRHAVMRPHLVSARRIA